MSTFGWQKVKPFIKMFNTGNDYTIYAKEAMNSVTTLWRALSLLSLK